MAVITPIELSRYGKKGEKLHVHFLNPTLTEEGKRTVDYLIEKGGEGNDCTAFISVQDAFEPGSGQDRYQKLRAAVGDCPCPEIRGKPTRVHLVEKSNPVQYTGLVFKSENNSYFVTPDCRIHVMTRPRSSINGATLSSVAGFDYNQKLDCDLGWMLEACQIDELEKAIKEQGRTIIESRFIVGRLPGHPIGIGFKTSNIQAIREATKEEIARYALASK